MFKSEMYKYTLVMAASFMSNFTVNKYYKHEVFYGRASHFLLVMRRGGIALCSPRKGNGLFCKLKLNTCFFEEKVWFIK